MFEDYEEWRFDDKIVAVCRDKFEDCKHAKKLPVTAITFIHSLYYFNPQIIVDSVLEYTQSRDA